MRRTILVLAAAAGVAVTSGCANSPQQVGGQAAPAGAITATTPAAPSASPSITPSVSPSITSASPKPSKTSSKPKTTYFGPTGYSKLKIGMSVKNAAATGELVSPDLGEGCGYSVIKAANDAEVMATHSSDRGLIYIPAWGKLTTPEGIRIGSTYAQVREAYPDFVFRIVEEDFEFKGDGDGFAGKNDGHTGVHYRFRFADNKLTELGLEHDKQNCYE